METGCVVHGDTHRRAALLEVLCLRSNKTQNTTRDISTVPEGARCHNSTVCSTAPRTNSPIAQRSAIAQSDALQRCPPPPHGLSLLLPPSPPLPAPGRGRLRPGFPPPLHSPTVQNTPGPARLSSALAPLCRSRCRPGAHGRRLEGLGGFGWVVGRGLRALAVFSYPGHRVAAGVLRATGIPSCVGE